MIDPARQAKEAERVSAVAKALQRTKKFARRSAYGAGIVGVSAGGAAWALNRRDERLYGNQ